MGRFGALWGGAVGRVGAWLRSGELWGVLGRSGRLWGTLGRSGALWGVVRRSGASWRALGCSGALWGGLARSWVLWGALGPSGALWGVLGRSGVYSGTECVVYTALPASLVSLYWFLQYTLGVLLNRGAEPTAPQSVWYMQHFRHQSSFCIVFYNTFRGVAK